MLYRTTRRVSGSEPEALRVVRDALIANGFTVAASGQTVFTVLGPGLRGSRQNPIRGMSKAVVRIHGSEIEMEAELGAVARFVRFVVIFPFVLVLVLAVVIGAGQWIGGATGPAGLLNLLLVPLVWLALGPVVVWRARKRTVGAIEALITSAAGVARPT